MKRVKKEIIKISKIKKGKTVLLTLIPTNILLPLLPPIPKWYLGAILTLNRYNNYSTISIEKAPGIPHNLQRLFSLFSNY